MTFRKLGLVSLVALGLFALGCDKKATAPPAAPAAVSAVVLAAPTALAKASAPTSAGEGEKTEVKGPTGDASVGGAGVNGGAVANAGSVVARMKGRFRACYQAGLNSNPDMAGSVTLMATIGPNGEVQSVGGGGGSLGAIMGCLKGVVSGAAFSPPEGGKAFVSIPITFVKQ